jgi:hypothetical protein
MESCEWCIRKYYWQPWNETGGFRSAVIMPIANELYQINKLNTSQRYVIEQNYTIIQSSLAFVQTWSQISHSLYVKVS